MDIQTKEMIKGQLENYLQSKGINTRKNFKCLLGRHTDNSPSMSYNKNNNTVRCFACNETLDIFDLIGIEYNLTDFKDKLKKASELTGIDYQDNTAVRTVNTTQKENKEEQVEKIDLTSYINECKARVKDTDYFINRGISEDIIDKFNLGYDPNYNNFTEAVIIPTSKYSYNARNLDSNSKMKYLKSKGIYKINAEALKQDRPIFITEGEIDALSIETMGYKAIGIGGASDINKLLDEIHKVGAEKVPPIVISLDNDDAGIEQSKKLYEELINANINTVIKDISKPYKDPNERLINDKEGLGKDLKDIENNINDLLAEKLKAEAEEYRKQSTANYVDKFIGNISSSVNTQYIPTGFNKLDTVLDGGLYEGLYIIGAISSLGKTTLVLQIADQIAEQGTDVIIYSLEMAKAELMAKSISRETLIHARDENIDISNAKTNRGITTGKRYQDYNDTELELINNSILKYKEYASNIFIYEGLGNIGVEDIRQQVEEHIRITGKRPLIVIDYIQILAPYDIRQSEKQATDKNVMELKRLSRDNKVAVIGISSFNRANYSGEVSMTAFKESGAIEYGSDVLIGLQFDGQGNKDFDVDIAKSQNPRDIELKILKNRNGSTGNRVLYSYYPLFNYFEEN